MKEVSCIEYVADDGTAYNNKEDCIMHEKAQEIINEIKKYETEINSDKIGYLIFDQKELIDFGWDIEIPIEDYLSNFDKIYTVCNKAFFMNVINLIGVAYPKHQIIYIDKYESGIANKFVLLFYTDMNHINKFNRFDYILICNINTILNKIKEIPKDIIYSIYEAEIENRLGKDNNG